MGQNTKLTHPIRAEEIQAIDGPQRILGDLGVIEPEAVVRVKGFPEEALESLSMTSLGPSESTLKVTVVSFLQGVREMEVDIALQGEHFKTNAAGVCYVPLPPPGSKIVATFGALRGSSVVFQDHYRIGIVIELRRARQLRVAVENFAGEPFVDVPVSMVMARPGFIKRLVTRNTSLDGTILFEGMDLYSPKVFRDSRFFVVVEGIFDSLAYQEWTSSQDERDPIRFSLPDCQLVHFELHDEGGSSEYEELSIALYRGEREHPEDHFLAPGLPPLSNVRPQLHEGKVAAPIGRNLQWYGRCWFPQERDFSEAVEVDSPFGPSEPLFMFQRKKAATFLSGNIVGAYATNAPEVFFCLWGRKFWRTPIRAAGQFECSVWEESPLNLPGVYAYSIVLTEGNELIVGELPLLAASSHQEGDYDFGNLKVPNPHQVSVVISESNGKLVEGASVEVWPMAAGNQERSMLPSFRHAAFQTNLHGKVSVVGDYPAEAWKVVVRHHLYEQWVGYLPSGSVDHSIVLQRLGEVQAELLLDMLLPSSSLRIGCEGIAVPNSSWDRPGPRCSGSVVWSRLGVGDLTLYLADAATGERLFEARDFLVSGQQKGFSLKLEPIDLRGKLHEYHFDVRDGSDALIDGFEMNMLESYDGEESVVQSLPNPVRFLSLKNPIEVTLSAPGREPLLLNLTPEVDSVVLGDRIVMPFRIEGASLPLPGGRLAIAMVDEAGEFHERDAVWFAGNERVTVPVGKTGPVEFQLLWDADGRLFEPLEVIQLESLQRIQVQVGLGENLEVVLPWLPADSVNLSQ